MKYVGSKNRLSKHIAPIIQGFIDSGNYKTYIEPFVGGCNMIDKIECEKRIGSDIHPQLIAFWKKLQGGWELGNTITENEYNYVRDHKDQHTLAYQGFLGFHATYGSKYFGGYARGFKADKVTPRDFPAEGIRNTKRQIPLILDVEFHCCNYWQFNAENAVVYCDPPYKSSTDYGGTDSFDHDKFWQWVRDNSLIGTVLVSEYIAPDDFECIWEKKVKTGLGTGKHLTRTEKLFIYRPERNE